jgi:hypothetical protein
MCLGCPKARHRRAMVWSRNPGIELKRIPIREANPYGRGTQRFFGLVLLVNAPTMAMSTSLAHNEVLQCKRVLTIRLRQAVGSDTAVRPPAASPPFAQVNIIASNNIRVSECSRSRCVKLSSLNLRQQRARIQFRGGVARTTRFQHVRRVQRRRRSGMHQYPVRCA